MAAAFSRLRSLGGLAAAAARALAVARSGRSHPVVEGRLRVGGLDAAAEVVRDRHGVPHVEAASDAGALFGLGFVHGQDRLFQIELFRRAAAGRLAEVFGERALGGDRFARRLGFAARAERDLAASGAEARELLEAYAAGVNAAVAAQPALPPEFAFAGAEPAPWRARDPLLVARLLMFGFATNWDAELQRERLLAAVGPERAALLDAAFPAGAATTTGQPHEGASERLLEAYRGFAAAGAPAGGASNAWAVAGSRTVSGFPLLASDPHLRAAVPAMFHVVHIAGGSLDVVGAGVPGVPGVVIGHNREVAWGMTAGLADVSDCYVEEVDPARPGRYRTPDGWERAEPRVERIEVRGGAAVEETVFETRHGPIVGPALPGEDRAIALRSTALEAGDTVGPLLDANRATSAAAFAEAIARWPGATFNFVYADRAGAIGYRMTGAVPRRARGQGLLPRDGAASSGPPDSLPPEAMPSLLDPPSGAVVSANQAPGGPHELGEEWTEGYRAERIAALLDARGGHTVASMQAIQHDLHNAALAALRDLLTARGAILDAEAAAAVAAWDGQSNAGSAGAAIVQTIYAEAARALVARVAGDAAELVLGRGLGGPAGEESRFHYRIQRRLVAALADASPPWCDGEADRDRVLRAAAERAIGELRDRLGGPPRSWRWGALRRQRRPHSLARAPLIGRAFSIGPFALPGDANTVWQGGYALHLGPGATGAFSPSYRQVVDLERWDRSTFQLPTGNSGIPGHPRYDDCAREFLAGIQRPLLFTREAVRAQAEHVLTLEPLEAAPDGEGGGAGDAAGERP